MCSALAHRIAARRSGGNKGEEQGGRASAQREKGDKGERARDLHQAFERLDCVIALSNRPLRHAQVALEALHEREMRSLAQMRLVSETLERAAIEAGRQRSNFRSGPMLSRALFL